MPDDDELATLEAKLEATRAAALHAQSLALVAAAELRDERIRRQKAVDARVKADRKAQGYPEWPDGYELLNNHMTDEQNIARLATMALDAIAATDSEIARVDIVREAIALAWQTAAARWDYRHSR